MNAASQINSHPEGKKPVSVVLIMVCIYIFLVIERPWESIRYLEGIPIERAYAVLLIVVALLQHKFKLTPAPTNKWVYGLLGLHFILAPFAFNPGYAVEQGVEYAKMVVLYLLMLSVADDEDALKLLIKAYVFSTMLYVLHSFWEYTNGRHVWRMGIARMMGVDSTFNDPNSFGATIVLSLPFVYALLRSELNKHLRWVYYTYFGLAVICVVLTGSRTSFAALLVLCTVWVLIQQGKRKMLILVTTLLAMVVVWNVMPAEKQERFRTLWDDEAGPANAKASADGRLMGWKTSYSMFKKHPFTGVGAGSKNFIGYRMTYYSEDGEQASNQAHNVYGEVLAEFGLPGGIFFVGIIASIYGSCRKIINNTKHVDEDNNYGYLLASSIIVVLILLLIFGIGGHNFYRPLWLWIAAWSSSIIINKTVKNNMYTNYNK